MVHIYPLEPDIENQEYLDFSINLWAYISLWRPRIIHVKSQAQNDFFGQVGFG
jgi:hypothetical protein